MNALAGLKLGLTVSLACRTLAQAFRVQALDSPELDARILVSHALGLDRTAMAVGAGRQLGERDMEAITALAARRLAREPVARIVGCKEFWSLNFRVNPDVLVPRPETETVVEAALGAVGDARMNALRILDIGTGSGALLLALLSELPHAYGIGTDISAAALSVARDNAHRLGLAARCAFVQCDIASAMHTPFDLVVSNPPYVAHGEIAALAPEVRDYDPALALDGGADGLDGYRAIAADARRLLAPGGRLVVELGAGQEADVTALFRNSGLMVTGRARHDLAGIARALSARSAP